MIYVERAGDEWMIREDDELLGSSATDYPTALTAFVANWPRLADELDALLADYYELAGAPVERARAVRDGSSGARTSSRKPGSGARFRELIAGGASNAEALATVRAEFPESKATLSDAAWNRAKLLKEGGSIAGSDAATKKGAPCGAPSESLW